MESRFSDRIGVTAASTVIQVDSMSDELRNSLWNLLSDLYDDGRGVYWRMVASFAGKYFFKVAIDDIPPDNHKARIWLKRHFFSAQWHGVYNLLEFVAANHRRMTAEQTYGNHTVYHVFAYRGWIFELKYDGFRCLATKRGKGVRLESRRCVSLRRALSS